VLDEEGIRHIGPGTPMVLFEWGEVDPRKDEFGFGSGQHLSDVRLDGWT
jgi:hypothetical protein